jgi:hypothetical protein
MHCHIAWHSSQGFALQIVESETEMRSQITDSWGLGSLCHDWNSYAHHGEVYVQDDAGI